MRTAIISLALLALGLVDVIVASPIIGTAVERALLAKRTAYRRNVDHDCYYQCPPTQGDVALSAFPSFRNYAAYTAVGCTYADVVCWYRTDNAELINDDSQECELSEAPWAGCGARFTNDPIYFNRDLSRELRGRTADEKAFDRRQVDPAKLKEGW
ncbi:hypothetical protein JCM24511_03319 [Saitozyma sp. JCM 24511]|nr:hypothetical protein JCM24511_03319 [Saitozyma sp. JCM 24511]